MWVTLIPSLFKFNRYAKARYGEAVSHMCAPLAHTCSSLCHTYPIMILMDIRNHRCPGLAVPDKAHAEILVLRERLSLFIPVQSCEALAYSSVASAIHRSFATRV